MVEQPFSRTRGELDTNLLLFFIFKEQYVCKKAQACYTLCTHIVFCSGCKFQKQILLRVLSDWREIVEFFVFYFENQADYLESFLSLFKDFLSF